MRLKNYVVITFGSYIRIKFQKSLNNYVTPALGSYVIKPCKWNQKVTQ